ncbi:Bro-N domain-containing protein [Streptomyces sp. NPDC004327]|uniref:BRO-N domain-containing protein n=1 Tax=Streptomyces sp. NPDC004327 TaxID=3364699 RepID=UPI0036CF195F
MNATDAIDVDDFVYAATGARLRRLTLPDGTHWFPAVDAARRLGYASARQALRAHVAPALHTTVGELPGDGDDDHSGLKPSTRVVCLEGLVQLVNASTRSDAAPFKAWVAEVVAGLQRDGSYGLEISPLRAAGFVLPQSLLDVLVRLEEGELRLDEEQTALLREAGQTLHRIAESLQRVPLPAIPAQRGAPALTSQELLDSWCARNLVVSPDVHAVAAYLAPALVRGGVRYRLEEVARRTGLTAERVRDCVRVLVERGCMRYAGGGAGGDGGGDGGLLYVLP